MVTTAKLFLGINHIFYTIASCFYLLDISQIDDQLSENEPIEKLGLKFAIYTL